jgi:hypothetical protein
MANAKDMLEKIYKASKAFIEVYESDIPKHIRNNILFSEEVLSSVCDGHTEEFFEEMVVTEDEEDAFLHQLYLDCCTTVSSSSYMFEENDDA